MMSKASDIYNDLPITVRVLARPLFTEMRINQIRIDQDKAKDSYLKFMKETNAHISNLEKSLEADLEALSNGDSPQLAKNTAAKPLQGDNKEEIE
jgi:hypothetical protein